MSNGDTIAVVGAGNIGGALLSGLLAAKAASPDSLIAADASETRLEQLRRELGLKRTTNENRAAAFEANIVVVAVKPHRVVEVLSSMASSLGPEKLVISVAAAVTIAALEEALPQPQPIVRAMPNIAMTAHASATALCANRHADGDHVAAAQRIFSTVGEVLTLEEPQFHAFTALAGSGPAYVYLLIEALAAGGVKMGLPPQQAARAAVQTFYGAAKLARESQEHPAALRDRVTTPAGTTIYGLHELELAGVRGALTAAVEAAAQRSSELGQLLEESRRDSPRKDTRKR